MSRSSRVLAEVAAAAMAQYWMSVLLARMTAAATAREQRELEPDRAGR